MLEIEFHDELNQPRRRGAGNPAEVRVLDLSIHRRWAVELRVVEGIECLRAKFERFGFGQTHIFLERQIEVINARPIENAPLGVAQFARILLWKQPRVESRSLVELSNYPTDLLTSPPQVLEASLIAEHT